MLLCIFPSSLVNLQNKLSEKCIGLQLQHAFSEYNVKKTKKNN